MLATEPPDLFLGFGSPVLAPVAGEVVGVHDDEVDHAARRSQLALVPYALGQAGRLRQGLGAVGGNHVVISQGPRVFVAVMHLQAGSVGVSVGQTVADGEQIARCGNSGNSTQPHVHLQAMDSPDARRARGLPLRFRRFAETLRGADHAVLREGEVPAEASVVAAAPA